MKDTLGLIRTALFAALIMGCAAADSNELMGLYSQADLEKTAAMKSYYAEGQIKLAGLNGTVSVYFVFPDKYRMNVSLSVLNITEVYNGRKGWMIDQNGQLVELKGHEKENLINSVYLAGYSFLRQEGMKGDVALQGDTLINDSLYKIFSSLPDGGDSLWLYYNTASERVEIIKEYLDEIVSFTYLQDFRVNDGFKIAFSSQVVSSLPALNASVSYTKFEINPELPDSLFDPAPGSFVDYEFPADLDSAVIPMVYHEGHIFIRANVNGDSSRYFILDSGAGLNILNKSYADKIKVLSEGGFAAKGVAGYGEASVGRIDSMILGGIGLFNQSVAVTDLDQMLKDFNGKNLGGIIGYDVLSRFPFKVDYASNQLIFYRPDRFVPPDDYNVEEFEYFLKIPSAEVLIANDTGVFIIDLGNAYSVILHNSFVERNNLEEKLKDLRKTDYAIGGIGGVTRVSTAFAPEFEIAGIKIESQEVWIAESKGGVIGSEEIDGNIGNRLLEKFSIILDYRSKKMYIKPLL